MPKVETKMPHSFLYHIKLIKIIPESDKSSERMIVYES